MQTEFYHIHADLEQAALYYERHDPEDPYPVPLDQERRNEDHRLHRAAAERARSALAAALAVEVNQRLG